MTSTLSNNLVVDRKQPKQFRVEFGGYYQVSEWRRAESESQLLEDIKKNEPWRMPVTITEVKGES